MRDANRQKERFQLSLDGRQVASVVVGALIILGAVFILGLNVGKQLGERDHVARQPADPLAALDAPPTPPDAGEPPKLSYHEALTRNRPPEPSRAPAPKPAPVPPPKPTVAPPVAEAKSSLPPGGDAVPVEAAVVPPSPALDKPPLAAPATTAANFAIQVGATQEVGEAHRIANRFKGHKPRIVSADIPGKGRWYRVKVGAFGSRADAERYLTDLSRETSARGFITAYK